MKRRSGFSKYRGTWEEETNQYRAIALLLGATKKGLAVLTIGETYGFAGTDDNLWELAESIIGKRSPPDDLGEYGVMFKEWEGVGVGSANKTPRIWEVLSEPEMEDQVTDWYIDMLPYLVFNGSRKTMIAFKQMTKMSDGVFIRLKVMYERFHKYRLKDYPELSVMYGEFNSLLFAHLGDKADEFKEFLITRGGRRSFAQFVEREFDVEEVVLPRGTGKYYIRVHF